MGLVTLNFDLLTLKLVCRSHVCWAISLPILVFLALLVLELFTMYATDRRTDGRTKATLNAPYPTGGGIIMYFNYSHKYTYCVNITISPIYQRYFLYVDPSLVAYANPVDAAAAR